MADGVDPAVAADVAEASGGRLDRARLLASDAGFGARRAAWQAVPSRLDGTGATVAVVAAELVRDAGTRPEWRRWRPATRPSWPRSTNG